MRDRRLGQVILDVQLRGTSGQGGDAVLRAHTPFAERRCSDLPGLPFPESRAICI